MKSIRVSSTNYFLLIFLPETNLQGDEVKRRREVINRVEEWTMMGVDM